jgi:undecaprenyl-diphosphatase
MKHHSLVRRVIAWVGGLDLILMMSVLAIVLGALIFIVVADLVAGGATVRIDDQLIHCMRNPVDLTDPIGPEWLEDVVRDLTSLGSAAILGLVTTVVVGFLLIRRTYHAMGLLLISTLGGLLLSLLLKGHFSRPRPDVVPRLAEVYTSSFPSGHSMLSAVIYLTLGALLSRLVERKGLKVYILSVAMLLALLVGVSRVYLGVHYPTDVLAGWSIGLSWAILCWLVARKLQRKGVVERSAE